MGRFSKAREFLAALPLSGGGRGLLVGIGCLLSASAALAALDLAFPPDLSRYKDRSVEVRAEDGRILRAFLSKDDKWRLTTRTEDVDPLYIKLLKAYEDKRFDAHWGVDPLAGLRALGQLAAARRIVSGASTLTMQTARLLEPGPRGIGAKLKQVARAFQLERRYSKREILSIYLTLAPFGGNIEGVRAASLAYFDKEPKQLTAGEAALLVALPQSPERLRPDIKNSLARQGRDKVLERLSHEGVLTAAALSEARATALPERRFDQPMLAPRFTQALAARAGGGAIIRTPIKADWQTAVEALARKESAWFPDGASMAALVIDNETRAVRAYLDGLDFWSANGQIDLARAVRSPGSALKPLIYGLAFDELPLHPETVLVDEPLMFGDYAPQNFDRGFQGMVTVRGALQASLNVPAVAMLDRLSPVRFAAMLNEGGARLSFPGERTTPGLPMALGGVGITLFDLAKLYVALADEGVAGDLRVMEGAPARVGPRLISKRAAWYVEDILRGSPMPDGWSRGQSVHRTRQIAFKTGTSYGFRDAWSVGYSRRYTVAVWVGRPDGSARAEQLGRNVAAPLVFKIFDLLPAEPPDARAPPSDAIRVTSFENLPRAMQRFDTNPQSAQQESLGLAAPQVAYPPDGSVLSLGTSLIDRTLLLRATGGTQPLRWLVNGQLLPPAADLEAAQWVAPGPGFARITVIDAAGRSSSADIQIKLDRS